MTEVSRRFYLPTSSEGDEWEGRQMMEVKAGCNVGGNIGNIFNSELMIVGGGGRRGRRGGFGGWMDESRERTGGGEALEGGGKGKGKVVIVGPAS